MLQKSAGICKVRREKNFILRSNIDIVESSYSSDDELFNEDAMKNVILMTTRIWLNS